MSRALDKFMYTTNYKQDFCVRRSQPREVNWVEEGNVDCCKPRYITAVTVDYDSVGKNAAASCPCQSGGFMPQRGAVASGLPTNLDKACPCFSCGNCQTDTRRPNQRVKKVEPKSYAKPIGIEPRPPSPPRVKNRTTAHSNKIKSKSKYVSDCFSPSFEPLRPLPRGKFGEHQRNAGDNKNNEGSWPRVKECPVKHKGTGSRPSDVRIPGPFWNRQKQDEGREVDAPKKRKLDRRPSEMRNGEYEEKYGGRGYADYSSDVPKACRLSSSEPGPNWGKDRFDGRPEKRKYTSQREGNMRGGPTDQFRMPERPDERREPEIDRKKKFGKQRIEAAEVIHGEEYRYPNTREGEDDESDEDQAQPFQSKRTCKCSPQQKAVGWDTWTQDNNPRVPEDVEKSIRQVPEARLSCAPAAETSKFDQPNTFMKKLYEKYPYLYQVLKETPPEELVSKVFKDRFLSTYQVDYLHMGIGKEQYPGGGAERDEIYTGPDGEQEPKTIPGCSYRFSKKGDFGRKKTVYDKKDKEEEILEVEKEEPRISEYMATISKLGGEIITDQLYAVAHLTKTMKNQYNNF